MATMQQIEAAAAMFAAERAKLTTVVMAFKAAIEQVKRAHLEGLKKQVGDAKATHAELTALIAQSPELFQKPRSVVFHGVKLGYVKGKGKMEIEDEPKTIALIRKHFPDQAEVLISVEEHASKKALEQLAAADLKKLGVLVTDAGDVVFAKDTTAEVDKLVAAFLKDDSDEEGADSERRAA